MSDLATALMALHLSIAPPAVNIPLDHGFKATVQPGFLSADLGRVHLKRGNTEFVLHWTTKF